MKTLRTYTKQAGITLVELMIAITIGLVLTGGLVQVYLGSKQSYNLAEASSRIQENGRFAIDLLARDIRMADFWGCLKQPDSDQLSNNIDTTSAHYDASMHGFADAVGGTNNDGYNNSDSITLGGAYGSGIVVEAPYMNTRSAVVHISTDNDLKQGDTVIISDCTQGDVFQITNANTESGSLGHNKGTLSIKDKNGNTVNLPGNLNTHNGSCPAGDCLSTMYAGDAQVYEVRNFTYDVRLSPTTGNGGLFRNGQEIIENVESMQILYGEDMDGDTDNEPPNLRAPDRYVPANAVTNPDNIVSVRVSLLVSSEDEFLPTATAQSFKVSDATVNTNDRKLRRVYNTTVTIRNRVP